MQRREGVKAGCNGKGIYGRESGENRRTGVKTCLQYGGKNIRNYIQYFLCFHYVHFC